jgi:hypothetical protein
LKRLLNLIHSLFYLILPPTKDVLMRILIFIAIFFLSLAFVSCNDGRAEQKTPLTPEQLIQINIDSLKSTAQEGDLLTRMNDNIVSYHVRNFNEKDRSFSHCGVVMIRDGQKMVCNIDANENKKDTVRYDPIDSFINPQENFLCGLFRFKLSETEKQNFIKELNNYHDKGAHFDRVFDLATDSLIYCSEMVAKSMERATNGRLTFPRTTTPKEMVRMMTIFFQKEGPTLTRKQIEKKVLERKYIPIDALFLNPNCEELMRFKLKHFPGT